jgi:hypothetical protein
VGRTLRLLDVDIFTVLKDTQYSSKIFGFRNRGQKLMKNETAASAKLQRWLYFSVSVALLPIFFNILGWIITQGFTVNFVKILGGGDLFLISTTLCAVALGELLEVAAIPRTIPAATTRALGAAYIIIIAISSFIYSFVSVGEFFLSGTMNVKQYI